MRKYEFVLHADSKEADQHVQVHSLIYALAFCVLKSTLAQLAPFKI